MREMAISKFKATCLAVLDQVRRTRKPIRITRFGEPIAEIVPPSIPPRSGQWLGIMKSTGRIKGDIVSPVLREREWEALRLTLVTADERLIGGKGFAILANRRWGPNVSGEIPLVVVTERGGRSIGSGEYAGQCAIGDVPVLPVLLESTLTPPH